MKKKDFYRGILIFNLPILLLLIFINLPFIADSIPVSRLALFFCSILFIAIVNLFYSVILKQVKNTLLTVEKALENIAQGNLGVSFKLKNNLIFRSSHIHDKLKSIIDSLHSTMSKIETIADGNLDNEFTNDSDLIEQKLSSLQLSLKNDKAELEKTKQEEHQRNWIANGLAKFGDILRQDNQNIKEMGYSIISNLVDYIGFNQGALYVINEDDNQVTFFRICSNSGIREETKCWIKKS